MTSAIGQPFFDYFYDGLFEYATVSGIKLRCTVCNATGYAGGRWQDNHVAGHPHTCTTCDRRFATLQGLGSHKRFHERES